jgi:hypothetical protein
VTAWVNYERYNLENIITPGLQAGEENKKKFSPFP